VNDCAKGKSWKERRAKQRSRESSSGNPEGANICKRKPTMPGMDAAEAEKYHGPLAARSMPLGSRLEVLA
jgi:hypothetical protein